MAGTTIYEFDALLATPRSGPIVAGVQVVPPQVYAWLETQALRVAEKHKAPWLRLTQRQGQRAVQVTSFVGVIRSPDGYQIEVLPKVAKVINDGDVQARKLLLEMLRCLGRFRHIQTDSANLMAAHMPLLEVFIAEFLRSVEQLIKRGIYSDYTTQQDNLFALRGKLQIATHMRRNLCRRDRFFTEFDEFTPDRLENRLLHSALLQVLSWTCSQRNQQLARELSFVFAGIPISPNPSADIQQVRLDRSMAHYLAALAWARLILEDKSPLTGAGGHDAPSLLFPMEAVFEAFVANHLSRQLAQGFTLQEQARSLSLVRHIDQDWFRLKPDLLVQSSKVNRLVLDTKWKLIGAKQATGSDKYGLAQSDFYQLYVYGQSYLDGKGDVILIYPKTESLDNVLPAFYFPKSKGLRLWVLPFCLKDKRLLLPECGSLDAIFFNTPQPYAGFQDLLTVRDNH
ncbi:McrC family protein [Hahella sp. CR1]|uniref:McrC family protein n=1 Tax=Hahella sp. CR1 TaxID=2992807 RepID=UPI002442C7F5|nr:McrC family protein [Hahella sp. CR1]MDG9671256.1 McrC family protein [Hahella sp. CR1]